jgi:hypothetical protein
MSLAQKLALSGSSEDKRITQETTSLNSAGMKVENEYWSVQELLLIIEQS